MSSGLTESQSAQAVPPTHQVKVRSRSSASLVLERVIADLGTVLKLSEAEEHLLQ